MSDYLNLAKELSRKHCLTVGNAHQALADILQEVIEAERAACKQIGENLLDPNPRNDWFLGRNSAVYEISRSIDGRGK